MRLSVIIITFNEARNIDDCLRSVAWADEIIVLDSGSDDDTVERCRAFNARVEITDWPGFGAQKNRALERARGEWVLSLDADERVSPELRAEIEQAMAAATFSAWRMPRRSWFCGRFMRHGGWYPDYIIRLFRRDQARFSEDLVHERLIPSGPVGTLRHPLLHYPYRTLEQVLAKIDHYSTAGARQKHAQGRRGGLARALLHGSWAFLRTYILRLGFLDGRQGFLLATMNAETTYYRYLKMQLLEFSQTDP